MATRANSIYTVIRNNTNARISTHMVHGKDYVAIAPHSYTVINGALLDGALQTQQRNIGASINSGDISVFILVKTPSNNYQAVPVNPSCSVQLTDDMIAAMIGFESIAPTKAENIHSNNTVLTEKATDEKTNNVLAANSVNLMSAFGANVAEDQPINHARNIRSEAYGFVKVTPGTTDKKEAEQAQEQAQEQIPVLQTDKQYVNSLYAEKDYQTIVDFLKEKQYKDNQDNVIKVTKKAVMSCNTAQQLEEKLNFKF